MFIQHTMCARLLQLTFLLFVGSLCNTKAAPPQEVPPRPPMAAKTVDAWTGMPDGFEPRGKMEHPAGTFWDATFGSPMMLFFLLLAMGVNVYLAREVAHCNRYPAKIVCGLSVVGPFLAPLIFLLLPKGGKRAKTVSVQTVPEPASATPQPAPDPQPIAQADENGVVAYYHSSQVKFNRHFFNTELMRFMRAIPSETEWLLARTKRGEELWACRIATVSEETVTLVVAAGNIWDNKVLRMYEIEDIQIILNQ